MLFHPKTLKEPLLSEAVSAVSSLSLSVVSALVCESDAAVLLSDEEPQPARSPAESAAVSNRVSARFFIMFLLGYIPTFYIGIICFLMSLTILRLL